jgi:NADPH:quinone reductase-like Zn-dependent oxidoreductase
MKAIICTAYGSPDVLRLQEVDKPSPGDNEVRIKIHASTVGPAECAFRKGDPFAMKATISPHLVYIFFCNILMSIVRPDVS